MNRDYPSTPTRRIISADANRKLYHGQAALLTLLLATDAPFSGLGLMRACFRSYSARASALI